MQATISFGESITKPDQLFKYSSIKELLEWQAFSEKQEWLIEDLRRISDKKARNELKKKLPYIVASHFEPVVRNTKNLKKTNGMIFDVDGIENVEELFTTLEKDPYIHWMFRSPSGNGIKFGIMLETYLVEPEFYSNVYKYASKRFSETYNIKLDHTSDCARACFLSFDPNYHYKDEPAKFPIRTIVEKPTPIYVPNEFESDQKTEVNIISEICRSINITDYHDWVEASMALESLGSIGESLFLELSTGGGQKDSISSLQRKFRSFRGSGIGIATFFHVAKKYGADVSEIYKRHYSS